jgi:hypothetical protein
VGGETGSCVGEGDDLKAEGLEIGLGVGRRVHTLPGLNRMKNEALINEPEGFVWVGRGGPESDENLLKCDFQFKRF